MDQCANESIVATRLLVDLVCFMLERRPATMECVKPFFFFFLFSVSEPNKSVFASQRGAASGTPKYPHKTNLIRKVVLYVEVQHLVPARSTQINAGDRILDVTKAS